MGEADVEAGGRKWGCGEFLGKGVGGCRDLLGFGGEGEGRGDQGAPNRMPRLNAKTSKRRPMMARSVRSISAIGLRCYGRNVALGTLWKMGNEAISTA